MIKCGKGFLPECEYYTSAGCVSPFNCPYKWEEAKGNSATTAPDTGIQKYFQGLVADGVVSQEPMNYDAATLKIYIAYLEAENAELRAKLKNAIELPCVKLVETKEWIDRVEIGDTIREWAVVYIDEQGQFVVEPCKSKTAAEARLKELEETNND